MAKKAALDPLIPLFDLVAYGPPKLKCFIAPSLKMQIKLKMLLAILVISQLSLAAGTPDCDRTWIENGRRVCRQKTFEMSAACGLVLGVGGVGAVAGKFLRKTV